MRPRWRIAYVMTDAAALALALSDLTVALRHGGFVDVTVTAGQAFGGDLEAVNVASALAVARGPGRADAVVVAMGPGAVGTGTALGFGALEEANVLDTAAWLDGTPIACVRYAEADARDLFLTLLGVSGVGPKIALATLAVYDAPSLRQALADGDVTALTRVPGIGKRGAERLVLELRDKIGPVTPVGTVALNGHSVRGPVVEALVGLGFAVKQAEEATDKVLANEPEATTSSALRLALSMLGRK